MMLRLLPRRTKKAPMIEVTIHTRADGQRQQHHLLPHVIAAGCLKKMAARTMVATVDTA